MLCLVAQSCPILCNPMDCSLPGSSVHGHSPGKNTGVGCHALLQGIFPTKRSNPGLLHCRWILYHLSHQGSHIYIANYLKCKWLKCINQKTKTGCMKTCIYALSLTTSLSLTPPLHKCMHLFYTVRLIMFPLWLATVILLFFVWLLIVKTDEHLLLL